MNPSLNFKIARLAYLIDQALDELAPNDSALQIYLIKKYLEDLCQTLTKTTQKK